MRPSIPIILLALPLFCGAAQASDNVPDFIARQVDHATVSATARAQYMMIDLYDATLYMPRGQQQITPPFALSLTYLRDFSGDSIADRAIEDMRNQGYDDELKLAAWHERLTNMIGEIVEGMTITGIRIANGQSRFYRDGEFIGKIDDHEFGKHFFNIWLSPNPDEPVELVRTANPT